MRSPCPIARAMGKQFLFPIVTEKGSPCLTGKAMEFPCRFLIATAKESRSRFPTEKVKELPNLCPIATATALPCLFPCPFALAKVSRWQICRPRGPTLH